MRNTTVYALLLLAVGFPVSGAGAQDEPPRAGTFVRVLIPAATTTTGHAQARRHPVQLGAGAALALATTSVGGETGTDVGPVISGLLGVALSSRTDLTAEVSWQPFKAHNPVRDEAFRAAYALAGLQVRVGSVRRVYIRPALGVVVRSWSGSDVFVGSETSGGTALAIGAELPAG